MPDAWLARHAPVRHVDCEEIASKSRRFLATVRLIVVKIGSRVETVDAPRGTLLARTLELLEIIEVPIAFKASFLPLRHHRR